MTEPALAAHDLPGADTDDRLADWLRLALTPGIGPVHGRRLLASVGHPGVETAGDRWRRLTFAAVARGLGSAQLAAALVADDRHRDRLVAASLDWRRAGGDHRILTLDDPVYPPRLLHLPDAPLVLYALGDPAWLSRRQLAVVGSRRATPLGLATARGLACALGSNGWVVTSGLAEGIDRAGHEGALAADDGATIAVMGTGIDRVYPSRHRGLAGRVRERGAIVTEQPLGMEPLASNFPRRNRLIAALTEGVLVVEAATSSGSLITAQIAAELGRDVFAVPGSIHSPQSRGCHRLLRNGAGLVETLDDIVDAFVLGRSAEPIAGPASGRQSPCDEAPQVTLEAGDAELIALLAGGPVDIDRLHATLGWPIARLLVRLQLLELQGLLGRDAGGDWFRQP